MRPQRISATTVLAATLTAVIVLLVSGCGTTGTAPTTGSSTPSRSIAAKLVALTDAGSPGPTRDYYWSNGPAVIDTSAMPARGSVSFGPDAQGRSGPARASLTSAMFRSSAGSRQGSPLDPPSWPSDNSEAAVTYALTGRTYHGYFWNRSHSVADSLAGRSSYTSEYNFTTGSREQNVGADQNGGMRAAEELAENYWKDHPGSTATIWYQTTPVYHGNERIPRGSIVDELSSDRVLNREIVVINDAEGWSIDYTTGDFSSRRRVPVPTPNPARD